MIPDVIHIRRGWLTIHRFFLDTSVLNAIFENDGYIFEGEPIADHSRYGQRFPSGIDELKALRFIFLMDERAMFDFVVTRKSLEEISATIRRRPVEGRMFTKWAFDIADHTEACLNDPHAFIGQGEETSKKLGESAFNYLSAKDRVLVRDAVLLECDAFLTLDLKLVKNAQHIKRELGLVILTPQSLWRILEPHINEL